MIQYLILYTVARSPVQYRVIASTKTAQEVAETFIKRHKTSRFVGIYKMELQEVKL